MSERRETRIQRIVLVTFLVASALLPGLVCAITVGFSSYHGDCTPKPDPDALVCRAG